MESDGLIETDNAKATWMDGFFNGKAQTPRYGKAVEINALWYNSLRIMENLADKLGKKEESAKYGKLAGVVKNSMQKFWNPDKNSLFDLIDLKPDKNPNPIQKGETTDNRVRPNQIFALSLPNRPFSDKPEIEKSILKTVRKQLLTPYGLRSLAKDEEGFKAKYDGDLKIRDAAYHQGTVWSWLIGPFSDAYFNVHGNNKDTKKAVYGFIKPLLNHMEGNVKEHAGASYCIGGMAEVFDATEPFYPKGATNQAWSVAEVLRVMDKIRDKDKIN